MSGLILAACLAVGAGAEPPPPVPAPGASTAQESFRAALEEAKGLWFRGETDLALAQFQRLYLRAVAGEAIPLELSGECAIYLGEIEIEQGRYEGAEAVWRWLLLRDPGYPISPYHHPIEVIGQFEMLRKQVVDAIPPRLPAEKVRYPAWGYAPFGIPQLRQGRGVRGGLYLGGQAVLAAVSVGAWIDLALANPSRGPFPADHPYGWTQATATQRLLERKYALNWPTTFGFYGLWVVSILDGQATFRRDQPVPEASARPALPVGIAGRW